MHVSSPIPQPRPAGRLGRRSRRRLIPWLVALALILAVAGGAIWQLTRSSTTTTAVSTATASRGDLSVAVSGSGTVEPAQSRALAFPVAGTVAEVLVDLGDTVAEGQPLATLDTTDLELALRQAEASLTSAQAAMATAEGAGATPAEIAAAEAQLRSAQASLTQTRTGNVTAAEIASAQAQLTSAQATLDELLAGPTAADLASARAQVEQARISLESQQTALSAAKTKAESAVTVAANNLRDAQDAYSTLYWQNRERESAPGGLTQAQIDEEAAALRAVSSAEESLKQAQLAYAQAQQDEITGLAQAESTLREAQTNLADLESGASAAEIASARASVASAKANLSALREPATVAELTIAQASVDQAQITLDQLSAPGSASTLAGAAATLAQAQVAYAQAQADLADAVLTAPFAGVVSEVAVTPGDSAGTSTTITVIDPSSLSVDLSLSESDIGAVAAGQAVLLSFDALPDVSITGAVERVAPAATVTSNVATYTVRVRFSPGDAAIKVGMTASGAIQTASRTGALLVPTRAIQEVDGASVVRVRQAAGQPAVSVRVETGLSNDGQTEIVSCLDTGDLCLQPGDTLEIAGTTDTTTTTTTNQGGLLGGPPDGGFGGPPPGAGR